MRKLIPILALLCLAIPSPAAITIAHAYNSRTSLTGLTSTTSGDGFVWVTNLTGTVTALSITGGDSFTKYGCLPTKESSENICVWYIANETSGGHTAITCTGCTGVNIYGGFEVSGQDTTTFIDKVLACTSISIAKACNENGAGTNIGLTLTPSFNSDAVYFQATCGGTAASFTGTGATWTSTITSGNPGASAVTSGFSSVNAKVDDTCGGENGVIIAVKGSGATEQCSADVSYFGYGAQATTGNPTIAANLTHAGNIIVTSGFVLNGFTSVSVGDGTNTFSSGFRGSSSSSTGEVFMDYLLNETLSGAQTITATITGSHTAAQIGYEELVYSPGCTAAFDVASSVGTGTGTAVNTPSITATTNAYEFMYTSPGTGTHVSTVNSPWSCYAFDTAAVSGCNYNTSVSANGFVQLATGSSTANAVTLSGAGGDWQAGIFSIKLTAPSTGGAKVHQSVIF